MTKSASDEVRAIYRALGCHMVTLSERRRTSRHARGVPDRWVFCPQKHLAWWLELKRPDERQSEAQQDFEAYCKACGVTYLKGGPAEVRDHLRSIGVLAS